MLIIKAHLSRYVRLFFFLLLLQFCSRSLLCRPSAHLSRTKYDFQLNFTESLLSLCYIFFINTISRPRPIIIELIFFFFCISPLFTVSLTLTFFFWSPKKNNKKLFFGQQEKNKYPKYTTEQLRVQNITVPRLLSSFQSCLACAPS